MGIPVNKRTEHSVDKVAVSQASRAMAKPATHEVPSLEQEWADLVVEKRRLEGEIAKYGQTAMLKAQAEIRKSGGDTLNRWIAKKSSMEAARAAVVADKMAVETRMMAIKERVRQIARDKNEYEDPRRALFEQMLVELRAIRSLLENMQPKQAE